MNLTDHPSRDATGLAELVAPREIHPRELLAAAFAAIERVNPRLNAVLHFLARHQRRPSMGHPALGLSDGDTVAAPLTYAEIDRRARAIAAAIVHKAEPTTQCG